MFFTDYFGDAQPRGDRPRAASLRRKHLPAAVAGIDRLFGRLEGRPARPDRADDVLQIPDAPRQAVDLGAPRSFRRTFVTPAESHAKRASLSALQPGRGVPSATRRRIRSFDEYKLFKI